MIPPLGVTVGIAIANGFCRPIEPTEIDYFAIIAASLLILAAVAACIALPLSLRGTKGNRPLRRELIISGLRNLLVDAVGVLTIGNGLTYGWYREEGGEWIAYQTWHESVITEGILTIFFVILVAELLRHLLRVLPHVRKS